jgi:hypothetical protein
VISRQLPAGEICRRFQPMSVAEMPAQHQATKPAFEADNMLVLHRSPDRNRRRQRFRQGRRRVRPEAAERAVYRCDQTPDLIDTDTVLPDITPNNLRNQVGIDFLGTAVVGHIFLSATSLIRVYVVDQASITISRRTNYFEAPK